MQKAASTSSDLGTKLTIISYVSLTFIGFFIIGLCLSVLPIFMTKELGYSKLVSGIVISLQYISTLVFRSKAGQITDSKGPKFAVLISMKSFFISGICLLLAYSFKEIAIVSMLILIAMRFIIGRAEGMVGATPINWAVMNVGEKHTATAISLNGIASYGALALGAPFGVVLSAYFSLYAIGILIILLSLLGYFLTNRKANNIAAANAPRESFKKVFGKVAPYGLGLAAGGLGFGAISTFMTLYYDYYSWANGALCMTVFGALFIFGRFIFSDSINNYGGIKVSIICLLVESLGLFMIFFSNTPLLVLIGAGVAGLGFSLVFPALGVVAMSTVSEANKGAALAGYGVFIDISLAVTGPIIGLVADNIGMPYIYLAAGAIVFIGFVHTIILSKKAIVPFPKE